MPKSFKSSLKACTAATMSSQKSTMSSVTSCSCTRSESECSACLESLTSMSTLSCDTIGSSGSSDSSSSACTRDQIISELCRLPCPPKCSPSPLNFDFYSMITPLNDMTTISNDNTVRFMMRRKNKVITLQWEPFSGKITTNGIAMLTVLQTLTNLPPHIIVKPIFLQYKNTNRMTTIVINPLTKNGNIFFYLNTDQSGTDINANDLITIPGGTVEWIVE